MNYEIDSMFGMKDKVIVVTGGTRGLGRELCLALKELGARVIAFGSSDSSVETARRELTGCDIMKVDVGSEAEVSSAAAAIRKKYSRVDGLVNCAGIQKLQDSLDIDAESFEATMHVNVTGTMLCAKYFGRIMAEQGRGRIVNCASVRASQGKSRYAAYAASKGAVKNLTRSLAVEFAPMGITVNCFSPCFLKLGLATDMATDSGSAWAVSRIPIGRLGRGEDMVGTVVFLLSEASAFVTGADIPVDGGWLAG